MKALLKMKNKNWLSIYKNYYNPFVFLLLMVYVFWSIDNFFSIHDTLFFSKQSDFLYFNLCETKSENDFLNVEKTNFQLSNASK